ncbi:flagellar brake domain-containing protein [Neobacillus sp. PS3-40]|uniref:flagellar brake protein n=1 Tax=Neobacillus sp. PS3-40 TaxID=3070679 RepID=UPI0027DF40D6|nr:flagellar brake domain-containing protein [Neobacillus sp. PS3-40]WML45132.1 flagellar brake domain-containing protein [Neobacillus sp. PS3-40]
MLHIGDVLTLELKNSDQSEKYKCRLVDRKGNDYYIDYPLSLETNRTVFLLDGTQLNVSFVGPDGSSVFKFETEIKGRIKKNIPMLIISYPGNENVRKIQRRQYVRIETSVDIAVHPLDFEFPPFACVADDISAGGVSFLVPIESSLKQGMKIQIWLVLVLQNGEYHYMKLPGQIARIFDFNETRNKISLQFNDITSQERQLLLRFCFDRQLEIRRKELHQ